MIDTASKTAITSGEGGDMMGGMPWGRGTRFVHVLFLKLGGGYVSVHSILLL